MWNSPGLTPLLSRQVCQEDRRWWWRWSCCNLSTPIRLPDIVRCARTRASHAPAVAEIINNVWRFINSERKLVRAIKSEQPVKESSFSILERIKEKLDRPLLKINYGAQENYFSLIKHPLPPPFLISLLLKKMYHYGWYPICL